MSRFLFADDSLVFYDADGTQLGYLGQVLTWLAIREVILIAENLRKQKDACIS